MKKIRNGAHFCKKEEVQKEGVLPIIVTGRTSKIVTERAKELNITELIRGLIIN